MGTKALNVGIMPYKDFKKYSMAIARGTYTPGKSEPKIWFESIETMSQVLSTRNLELLKLIEKQKPQSIRELAELSGRQISNLSRTLKTFHKYGLVNLIENKKTKMPVVKATSFKIEYGKRYPDFSYEDEPVRATN